MPRPGESTRCRNRPPACPTPPACQRRGRGTGGRHPPPPGSWGWRGRARGECVPRTQSGGQSPCAGLSARLERDQTVSELVNNWDTDGII